MVQPIHVLDSVGQVVMDMLSQHDGTFREPVRTPSPGAGKEVPEDERVLKYQAVD
jgi:hypothetical protein